MSIDNRGFASMSSQKQIQIDRSPYSLFTISRSFPHWGLFMGTASDGSMSNARG
jgi:hypothetical protein